MEQRKSIRRIMLDLLYIKDQVKEFFRENEEYMELLIFLTAKDYLADDIPIPTFKEIEEQTGIKMYHIRKRLLNMYNELFDSDEEYIFDFKKCEIIFFIKNNDKYGSFKCNNLSSVPRIGENVDIPFVRGKVGSDFFYVDDVRHSFQGKKQSIYIHLKCGMFNSYWYNRLHEAEVKRELRFNDFYDLSEWELKERLL